MKIVIVGHMDHGKSTLIGRLLYDTGSLPPDRMEVIRKTCSDMGKGIEFAFVMDHLKEEREGGMTIDTAQTFFKTPKRDYVIIDAPGHREFMKNMITGASQAETSLLVLDVNEGVMEQTKRHAYVLGLLNLKRNILVLNKMDLVGYREDRFKEVSREIALFLDKLKISPSFAIPISASLGDNFTARSDKMPWYSGPALLEALDLLDKERNIEQKPLRFPVQDVYRRNGKDIIAGRVESGLVRANDRLCLMPDRINVTVDKVMEFGRKRDVSGAGESIGLTINEAVPVKRGGLLSAATSHPRVGKKIHGSLFWMSPRPLKTGEPLNFRINTQASPCAVAEIRERINSSTLDVLEVNARELLETEVGEVILDLQRPVAFELFSFIPEMGRFVLERGNDIVAGGIITHEPANRRVGESAHK